MNHYEFDKVFEHQVDLCKNTLIVKGAEYSPEERFSNFRKAAAFQNTTTKKALGGMLAKHIVSIYDMIDDESADYPIDIWEEKIGDALNYLFLLKGIVIEEYIQVQPMPPANEYAWPECAPVKENYKKENYKKEKYA
jgi:hypothetical protein